MKGCLTFSTFIFWISPNLTQYMIPTDCHLSNITKLEKRTSFWAQSSNRVLHCLDAVYFIQKYTVHGHVTAFGAEVGDALWIGCTLDKNSPKVVWNCVKTHGSQKCHQWSGTWDMTSSIDWYVREWVGSNFSGFNMVHNNQHTQWQHRVCLLKPRT
jgi:hypothetical protein